MVIIFNFTYSVNPKKIIFTAFYYLSVVYMQHFSLFNYDFPLWLTLKIPDLCISVYKRTPRGGVALTPSPNRVRTCRIMQDHSQELGSHLNTLLESEHFLVEKPSQQYFSTVNRRVAEPNVHH